MDKTLIIYDLTGRVLSITYGAVDPPQGVPFVWCDIPPGAVVDHVDVATGQVVFEYEPESDLGRMQASIAALQQIVNDAQSIAVSAAADARAASAEAHSASEAFSEAATEFRGEIDAVALSCSDMRNNYTHISGVAADIQNSLNTVALTAGDALANSRMAVENASSANILAESNNTSLSFLQDVVEEVKNNALDAGDMAMVNSSDITDLQIGLAEVFEMLLGAGGEV